MGLGGFIGNFRHRLAVAVGHLQHDAHRLHPRDIARQVGADTKADIDAPAQRTKDRQRCRQIQPIGEHQRLGARIDPQSLVMRDGFFSPDDRVPRVMAQAIEELGEVQIEIGEEGIHGNGVGQRDTEQPPVFAYPAIQRGNLTVDQPRPELLMGHDPLVSHGAQRLDVQLAGQVHIAGADEACREVLVQAGDDFFLHLERKAPPRSEVRHLQLGQFIAAGVGLQPVELAIQLISCLAHDHVRKPRAVAHFAYRRQQRYLEQDHMQPRPAQANAQLIVLDTNVEVAQVEAEQPEKTQEIGLHEVDAFKKCQLVVSQAQLAHRLDVLTNLAKVRAQVLAVAAAELPFDVDVGVVMQHRLHHRQLVQVSIQQILHDTLGKNVLAHGGSLRARHLKMAVAHSCGSF